MRDDPIDLQSPDYTPGRLLNRTAARLGVLSLCGLARELEVDKALLSRMRNRHVPISTYLMVRIMDRTDWHIQKVRELAGIPYDGAAKLTPVISQYREVA